MEQPRFNETHQLAVEVRMEDDRFADKPPVLTAYIIPKSDPPDMTQAKMIFRAMFGENIEANLTFYGPDGSVLIEDSEFNSQEDDEQREVRINTTINEAWAGDPDDGPADALKLRVIETAKAMMAAHGFAQLAGIPPQQAFNGIARTSGNLTLRHGDDYVTDASGAITTKEAHDE